MPIKFIYPKPLLSLFSVLIAGLLLMASCRKRDMPTSGTLPSVSSLRKKLLETGTIGSLQVFTLAGNGTAGLVNAQGTAARFNNPSGTAVDAAGNVYIADKSNHVIRKMTASGVVTTLAGSGFAGYLDAQGSTAQFNNPSGVAVDAAGNVYVADAGNHVIRKITASGVVTTLAGIFNFPGFANGPGNTAQFNNPVGVALDASGNVLIADASNHMIRRITPAGFVSLVAGTGTPGSADGVGSFSQFNNPSGVAVDAAGNVYVADAGNNKIRKIVGLIVSTLAGNGTAGYIEGTGTAAQFNNPTGVAVDLSGNILVTDKTNHAIRQITASGAVSTLIGNGIAGFVDGVPAIARFSSPAGIAIDAFGKLWVADQSNQRIRELGIIATVSTLAGNANFVGFLDATGTAAHFRGPHGITFDALGNILIADNSNYRIRKVTPEGVVSTLAGNGTQGYIDGPGFSAQFFSPAGVATDAAGNIYVTEFGIHVIRKITPAGVVSTLAGNGIAGFMDGTGTAAQFSSPWGIATDNSGNVYVTEAVNHRIRKITAAGVVSTLAGNGNPGFVNGTGLEAQFNVPNGIAVDVSGNIYVADRNNQAIRKITPSGVVSTFAGGNPAFGGADGIGAVVQFNYPEGIAVDASGNIYVADTFNHRIRKITQAGVVSTVAANYTGGGAPGGVTDGPAPFARFNFPTGLIVDASGRTIYIADFSNNNIRKIQ